MQTWTVTARAIEAPLLRQRLLPSEYELREGNAATILLRLAWDQEAFIRQVAPKLPDQLEIPIANADLIRAANAALGFDGLYLEMRRAAYRRNADWQYPIREQAVSSILLPDLNWSRHFMRGLSVRIRAHIVDDDVEAAREEILVGLANARHIARTPFVIANLMAGIQSGWMLDRVGELLQREECPNLYWGITALPSPFIDATAAFGLEREHLRNSVNGLADLDRKRSAEEWQQLADRTLEHLVELAKGTEFQIEADRRRSGSCTGERAARVAGAVTIPTRCSGGDVRRRSRHAVGRGAACRHC